MQAWNHNNANTLQQCMAACIEGVRLTGLPEVSMACKHALSGKSEKSLSKAQKFKLIGMRLHILKLRCLKCKC